MRAALCVLIPLLLLTGCDVAFGPPPTLTPTLWYDPLSASPTPDIRFPTPMPNEAVPNSAGVTQPTIAALPAHGDITSFTESDPFRPTLITVQLADGQNLNAELYNAPGTAPGIILLGDTFDSWLGFPALIHQAGYTVLTVSGDQTLSAADVSGIFDSLAVQPSVDGARLLVIGVEEGADSGLSGCARDSRCIGAVLISPRSAVALEAALPGFGERPILVAASSEDTQAVAAMARVRQLVSNGVFQPFENTGIGTQILDMRPDFTALIITWLNQVAALR